MSADNESSSLAAPILLLVSAILGFIISNSEWAPHYFHGLHVHIKFGIDEFYLLNKSLLHIINDGFMVIFFLFIGLELKREIVVGELSDVKKATLPIVAAIGGMIIPALIYLGFNPTGEAAAGWGIPMATDIAFAMGVLAVLGSRVPLSLKVLLAAVAIVDDLGAILVIALFYTSEISTTYLLYAAMIYLVCLLLNRAGVMNVSVYCMLGIPLWYFMLKSGVHATIAGVLLASAIPLAPRHKSTARLIDDIFNKEASALDSPAVFLEKSLLKWVAFLIIPIFAFSNAGVALNDIEFSNISLGVMLGLFVGKPLGITGASYLATKIGIAKLPNGVDWGQFTGVGCLAGIGFTMSLFVSSLAFSHAELNDQAKLAILIGSFASAIVGVLLLARADKKSHA